MKLTSHLAAVLLVGALGSAPAFADPGRDHGRDHRHHHEDRWDRHDNGRHGRCPPGLAKHGRDCVPPGHARRHHEDRHSRVGDRFDRDRYEWIRDPRRYDLEQRSDWSYFRDGNRAYRVDNDTQRIIAVLDLIDAFTN